MSTAREAYLKTGEILPVFNPDLVDRAVETDTNCVMDYIERLYPIDNENLGWVEFIGQWMDMTKPSHLQEEGSLTSMGAPCALRRESTGRR